MRPSLVTRLAILLTIFIAMLLACNPCEAAPPNDNIANAQAIPTGTSFSVSGTGAGARRESFERATGYPLSAEFDTTVWYTWTPSISGELTLSTTMDPSGYPPVLLIFEGPGTPSHSTVVAVATPFQSVVGTTVTAGQQYFISSNDVSGDAGAFVLSGKVAAPSSNPTPTPTSQPNVTLVIKTPKVSRSSGAIGKAYIELSSAAAADLTITYKTGGTAVNGTDYKMLSGSVTVPTGATRATLKVRPRSDNTNTLGLTLSVKVGDGYTVGDSAKGKIKIVE